MAALGEEWGRLHLPQLARSCRCKMRPAQKPQTCRTRGQDPLGAVQHDFTSIGTVEQKSSEDQGIKGRIEKAANPSGKKKLKIFQPGEVLVPKANGRGT